MAVLLFLAAAAALAALFSLSRRIYTVLERHGAVRAAVAYSFAIFMLCIPAAALLAAASDRLREGSLDARAQGALEVLADLAKTGVVRSSAVANGAPLLTLLSGGEIERSPGVQYQPLLLKRSGAERLSAERNLPFLILNRIVRSEEKLRFPIDSGDRVESIALAMPASDQSATVGIAFVGPGAARRQLSLGPTAERFHGWGEGSDLVEVRSLDLTPLAQGATAIELNADTLVHVVGFTIVTPTGARGLMPEEHTRSGVPVFASLGSIRSGMPVRASAAPVEIEFQPPTTCDGLFFIYTSTDSRACEFRWFGEDIIDIRLEYADGGVPEQYTLKHGDDIHSGDLDRSRHADDLKSALAWTWDTENAHFHADERKVAFGTSRSLRKVSLRNVSGSSGYDVELLGITAFRTQTGEQMQLDPGLFTVRGGQTLALTPDARGKLGGVAFAWADRSGVVRAVSKGGPLGLLGTTLDDRDISEFTTGRWVASRCGELAGLDGELSVLPTRDGESVVGATILFVPENDRAFRRGKFAFLPVGFGIFIFPFLIIAFGEALARGDRLRRKIAISLVAAAVVPLGVMMTLIPPMFGSTRASATVRSLDSELQFWKERLVRKRDAASADAALFFKNLREHPRVSPLFLDAARADSEPALQRELGAARIVKFGNDLSFARLELRMLQTPPNNAAWRVIDDSSGQVALGGIDFQGSDYYKIGNRLFLVGVHRATSPGFRGRLILGSEVFEPSERGTRVRLLDVGGNPIDGRPLPPGSSALDWAEQISNAIRSNRPSTRNASSISIVDVFRDSTAGANPAFGIAVIDTETRNDILLFGLRLPLSMLLAIIGLLAVGGTLGVARIMTEKLTKPIEMLAHAADEARTAKTLTPVVTGSADEVGLLAERFHAMSSELVDQIHRLSEIQRGILTFAGRLDRADVAREASRFAQRATGADMAVVLLSDPYSSGWRGYYSTGRDCAVRMSPAFFHILVAEDWVVLQDSGATPLRALTSAVEGLPPQVRSVLAGPVKLGQRNEGLLLLAFSTVTTRGQREAARAVSSAIAIALENARAYGAAIEDSPTGAWAAHFFELKLIESVERARSIHKKLILIKIVVPPAPTHGRDTEQEFVALARRLVRFLQFRRRGFAGRTGPLDLTIAAEDFDPMRQEAFAASIRKFTEKALRVHRLELGVRSVVFPDEASSAEDLMRRLSRPAENSVGLIDPAILAGDIPVRSQPMIETLNRAARLAMVDLPLLIVGESGTGKEFLARRIHRVSRREGAPFVVIDMNTLHRDLAETELFGFEAGAYSGATSAKAGLLEQASGGTVLFSEIQDCAPELQAKILRVLQERSIRRLGSSISIPLSFRAISTTSADLLEEIRTGRFRSDLYYRAAGAILKVPALRERIEDVPLLANALLAEESHGRRLSLSPQAIDRLVNHSWPGNITELRSVIRRAVIGAAHDVIEATDIEISRLTNPPPARSRVPEQVIPARRGDPGSKQAPGRADRSWNERQQRLLGMLGKGERITTTEYVKLMNVSNRTGLRDLDELVRWGRMRREGRKRGTSFKML